MRAAALIAAALLIAGCGGSDHDAASATTTVPSRHTNGGGQSPSSPNGGGQSSSSQLNMGATRRLTLRQAIGQRFVFAYSGLQPPRALRRRVARGEAAGVILFARNVRSAAQVRATVAKLQAIRRPALVDAPLLVMVDQEGGAVRRIPGPPAKGAAETASPAAARAYGAATGRLLRAAGVNVDLAPVVDVGRADGALANEGRVYDDDAAHVIAKAGAFAAGLEQAGVAPVLKHFPGFGAAVVNTDAGVARIDLSRSALRAVDLAPYRRISAPAVMVSTAIYPRVDPRPAAFASRWVTGELRRRIGFGGVTMTDDLQAPAVTTYGSPAQLAFFAVRAGIDMPVYAKDYNTGVRAAAGLERAVRQGALRRAAIQAGAVRVLRWRRGLEQPRR